jgi:Dullard-like phosphatase family protein
MIGTYEANESPNSRGVVVCQPEPTKMISSSCEVDDDQVFFTVSDVSVDHFVGIKSVIATLVLSDLDSISCEEEACEGCEDENRKVGMGSTVFGTCETHATTRIGFANECPLMLPEIVVGSGMVNGTLKNGRRRVDCSGVITSFKKSMKMFISCVKPQVAPSSKPQPSQEGTRLEIGTTSLPDGQKGIQSAADEKASVGIATMSLSDEQEADFDDPPGLTPVQVSTGTYPAFNPVTSVSKDTPQFCPVEFYRQRVKRFMLTYKYSGPLLPDVGLSDLGKKCLVLDLDETLIHSQFNRVPHPDLEVPIQFENDIVKPIYVCKRPGVDEFLAFVGQHFEVIIFTASLASYADPVIDFLDKTKTIRHRLYRESCVYAEGLYLKDLSRLGRPLDQTILVDNAATSYLLQPENGVAIKSWFSDQEDTELLGRLRPALFELIRATDVFKWKQAWSHSISH